MQENEYKFLRLDDAKLKDVKYLFEKVFGKKVSIEYLKKKYDTSYTGQKYLCYLAYDKNNNPVSFHGCIPFKVKYKGSEYLAVQACDFLTIKEHQGKGLMTKLGEITNTLCASGGAKFIYGLQSENTYHTTKKLGWKNDEIMKCYELKVLTLPLSSIAVKFPVFEKLYRIYPKIVLSFLKSSDTLANSNDDNLYPACIHGKAFFGYKSYSLNRIINVKGYKIWIKTAPGLWIGDMENIPEADLMITMKRLKLIAFLLGCSKIVFQLNADSYLDRLFSKYYESFDSYRIGYLKYDNGFPAEKFKPTFGDLDSF
jgi:hypothetical protein